MTLADRFEKDPVTCWSVTAVLVGALLTGLVLLLGSVHVWGVSGGGGGYSDQDARDACDEIQSKMSPYSDFNYDACVSDFKNNNVPDLP